MGRVDPGTGSAPIPFAELRARLAPAPPAPAPPPSRRAAARAGHRRETAPRVAPWPITALVLLVTLCGGATYLHSVTGGAAADGTALAAAPADARRPSATASHAGVPSRVSRGENRQEPATALPGLSRLVPSSAPGTAVTGSATGRPATGIVVTGARVPGNWALPNSGPYTSCFCARWGTFHYGIDLAGPLGSPIFAAGDGVVLRAGPAGGFGYWVVLEHANGDVTIYGHMRYWSVTVGQHVRAGEQIAWVGQEGDSTGPHVHFGVRLGGIDGPYVDPVPWLAARGITVPPYVGA